MRWAEKEKEPRDVMKQGIRKIITRSNCALDRRIILWHYVTGFQRQIFKYVKVLSKRSRKWKYQKKNKGGVIVAESAYISQNAVWPRSDNFFDLIQNFIKYD